MQLNHGEIETQQTVAQRIRGFLEARHTVGFDDLCQALRVGESAVRSALDRMMARGEIECLRPIQLNGMQREHYRLHAMARYPFHNLRQASSLRGIRGRLLGWFRPHMTAQV